MITMLSLLYKSTYVFVVFYYAIVPLGYLTKWWVTETDEKMKGNNTILVTGGAGYVGSHTVVELLKNNYTVIAIDNLVNCYARDHEKPEALLRVEKITGEKVSFYDVDIRDKEALDKVFKMHKIDSVIHFAALKAVGESVKIPLKYYQNNIAGSATLFEVMANNGVKSLVFSSSATVYGNPRFLPITEEHPTGQGCTNPYGKTKYFVEEILKDLSFSDPEWKVILLRYFNPVGAHESGLIGEDPSGIPNNLMPYISQVAVGRREKLQVFGNDYPTHDGTGVRDYIHITDLAVGHLKALERMLQPSFSSWKAYNLGTGRGYSVLDVVKAFEKASGKQVKYEIVGRRAGDVAECYADATLAKRELNWTAARDIYAMCKDTWNWQQKNPKGFHSS
ncbi:UDP-glucose 4-epimerase isoform X1 [Anthonomus grandis grandis]|uniref:UDP-glucose 4-epimerase isoform X1 n=2 Tax=Anthonomus grandis grandis TaxID=2921223 RepID=UPI002164F71B|nr:UDP-glucose 4-epimerase isoform X1 [Anthonomus grandis grandis]